MAAFVVDASVCLAWCFPDESTPEAEALLQRLTNGEEIAVAAHWPLEVLNAAMQGVRRRRISARLAAGFLTRLASFRIQIDAYQDLYRIGAIRQLAERRQLTAYDAAYLELAMRLSLPLATLDAALRKAAEAEGVTLL